MAASSVQRYQQHQICERMTIKKKRKTCLCLERERQRVLLVSLLLLRVISTQHVCLSFEWSTGGRPEVDRRAIAGLWRLTPQQSPMKEFTVYPKRGSSSSSSAMEQEDVLLMLKEDGSFQQYTTSGGSDGEDDFFVLEDESDIDDAWSQFQAAQKRKQERLKKRREHEQQQKDDRLQNQELKGVWDFIDGKLILAADRPKQEAGSSAVGDATADTMLTGRVVASYETSLKDNPVLASSISNSQDGDLGSTSSSTVDKQEESSVAKTAATTGGNSAGNSNNKNSNKKIAIDTHLTVPVGSVKVGRFFYPRNHPSFFEQPMFQPVRRGGFRLRQVLGLLNSKYSTEPEIVEKYQRSDFYNKTFLLSSHPLKQQTPKYPPPSQEQWTPKSSSRRREQEAAEAADVARSGIHIRVMQVQFHPNNTFSTLAGLGENILRGKFDVIGQDKDQLWFQVWRFGFGRSVSGSTFSEGNSLTHEDAKSYWGTIQIEPSASSSSDDKDDDKKNNIKATTNDPTDQTSKDGHDDCTDQPQRLEVTGSVLVGWGLEPLPVARFIMREMTQQDDEMLLEDDDEEEDEEDDAAIVGDLDATFEKESSMGSGDVGIDFSDDDSSAFQ